MTGQGRGALTGRTAVVSGAGRGIGRACATRLAELGADVAVLDIDLRSGERYAGEADEPTTVALERLGGRVLGVQADLTDPDAARAAVAAVATAWGHVDVLVHAAGGAITPFARSRPSVAPVADVRAVLDLNLMSAIHCCQAVVPHMPEDGTAAIVTVASTAAFSVLPGGANAGYAMSKAALVHWTRHLAADVGRRGIRVNMIAPGITLTGRVVEESRDTGFAGRAGEVPLGRLGLPEDCADVMEFLVGERSRFVTGRCIAVDGGWDLSPS